MLNQRSKSIDGLKRIYEQLDGDIVPQASLGPWSFLKEAGALENSTLQEYLGNHSELNYSPNTLLQLLAFGDSSRPFPDRLAVYLLKLSVYEALELKEQTDWPIRVDLKGRGVMGWQDFERELLNLGSGQRKRLTAWFTQGWNGGSPQSRRKLLKVAIRLRDGALTVKSSQHSLAVRIELIAKDFLARRELYRNRARAVATVTLEFELLRELLDSCGALPPVEDLLELGRDVGPLDNAPLEIGKERFRVLRCDRCGRVRKLDYWGSNQSVLEVLRKIGDSHSANCPLPPLSRSLTALGLQGFVDWESSFHAGVAKFYLSL